jgi:hypothetical protein
VNTLWCAGNLVSVNAPEDDAWEASKRVERDIKKVLLIVCDRYTRWFKYDRDKLWLVYTQIVLVIFEPPCILSFVLVEMYRWRQNPVDKYLVSFFLEGGGLSLRFYDSLCWTFVLIAWHSMWQALLRSWRMRGTFFLSPRNNIFNSRSANVEFVVDNVTFGQAFLWLFSSALSVMFDQTITTPYSVVWHVHSLFQSQFSKKCDLVLPISSPPYLLFFSYGHSKDAYVFFLVFPSLFSPSSCVV